MRVRFCLELMRLGCWLAGPRWPRASGWPIFLSCGLGPVLSAFAQDVTPPSLVSAGSATGQQIGICFSEELTAGSLAELSNYLVEDSEGIKGVGEAVPQPGNQGVILNLVTPVTGQFVVTAGFLFDLAGNLLEPGSSVTGRVWHAPLSLADIGGPMPTGSVFSCTETAVSLGGDGEYLHERVDRCVFLHVRRTNNFDVTVRLDELRDVAGLYGGAGLMVRESIEPGSVQRTLLVTSTNTINRIYALARPSPNALAGQIDTGPRVQSLPLWLRMKRAGTFITCFISRDAAAWEQVGSTLGMPALPAEVVLGLTVGAASLNTGARATFADFGDTLLYPEGSVVITQPPANLQAEVHQTALFTVGVEARQAPASAVQYQWQAETSPGSGQYTNIVFANTVSHTTRFLDETHSGASFRVAVWLPGHPPVYSAPALLTVGPDLTGPRVVQATGTRLIREILLTFNEPLERAAAANFLNYSVAGIPVTNALVDPTGSLVLLQLAEVQPPGTSNVVVLANLADLAGNRLSPDPLSVVAPALGLAPGYVLRELYYGVVGNTLLELLFSPFFPVFPNDRQYVTQLEGLNDITWEYGTRLSGFLRPPLSGRYHFWMCSDDQGEFRLSTNADPAHLVLLCREPQFNPYRDYLSTTRRLATAPENRSQTLFPDGIALEAGRLYYFEALNKNAAIYGNLSVTWQLPGGPAPTNGAAPISGEYLAASVDLTQVQFELTQDPLEVTYSFAAAGGSGERLVLSESFDVSDGGFQPRLTGDPTGGWVHRPPLGAWTTDGSGAISLPSDKTLTSLPLTVTRAGQVHVSFNHRYSFEFDGSLGWDGGQLRVSVNGGPFAAVPSAAFLSNGYTRVVQGIAGVFGEEAFNGNSPGYDTARNITSRAAVGYFEPGNVLQIQFFGGWDEFTTGLPPNWLLDRVQVVEGLSGGPAVTFSVAARGTVSYAPNQLPTYQWQRDCGQGFIDVPGATAARYSFTPTAADAGCRFRCAVSFPGSTLLSRPATLAIPGPFLTARRQGAEVVISWTETGRLQEAPSPAGPWTDVGAAGANTYASPVAAAPRFYRIQVP